MDVGPAIFILALTTLGCSSAPQSKRILVDPSYTAVSFQEHNADISPFQKQQLNKLAALIRNNWNKISELKIISWPDKEYEESKLKSNKDIRLARHRAQAIKTHLNQQFIHHKKISIINMAKGPSFINSEDAAIKKIIEETGVTGTKLPTGEISYTKSGKAFVILDYKKGVL